MHARSGPVSQEKTMEIRELSAVKENLLFQNLFLLKCGKYFVLHLSLPPIRRSQCIPSDPRHNVSTPKKP